MTVQRIKPGSMVTCVSLAALSACGGNSGSYVDNGGTTPALVATFSGTAATGKALAGASVKMTNPGGSPACVETPITTAPDGTFSCTLKSGVTAPIFVVVTDPLGNTTPLVSIATKTPASGSTGQINVTPLTTAIVGQLNGGDAQGVVDNAAAFNAASAAALNTIKTNVVTQIQNVLNAIDSNALLNYDPFSTPITATTLARTGNAADRVLEVIQVVKTETGEPAFATVSEPAPIPMAGTTPAATQVPATAVPPIGSPSDLGLAVQQVAQAFASCFALPVAQRVTLDANQFITRMAVPCNDMVTSADQPSSAPAFKNNGYEAASWFYRLLTDDKLTRAVFSPAEVMALYPADVSSPRDIAIFNVPYVDNQGTPGNIIIAGQNFPVSGTTAHSSTWWITGNQKHYDISVGTSVSRRQLFNTHPSGEFSIGLDIRISGESYAPHASSFDVVLVKGPGLPTSGLWYGRRNGQSLFEMSSNRGAPPQLLSNLASACSGCITFRMARTAGITAETGAGRLGVNVNHANWAQGNDGSFNGAMGTRPAKGAVYTFSLYQAGAMAATETRRLLTTLTPVTLAAGLPWHGIGSNLAAAVDLGLGNTALFGEQTSLWVDWIKNPWAEPVSGVYVSQNNGAYENATKFPIGATSVLATPVGSGNKFTSLNGPLNETGPVYGGYREIGLTYRTVDGSDKIAAYAYYP